MSDDLAARIRQCADLAGSGDELARLTAIPRRTLEYYLTGQSEPKVVRCVEIAKAVGVDIGWLASGEGEMRPQLVDATQDDDKYAYIPLYDARISAGHGSWSTGARILTHLAFTRYSLRKKGLDPANLSAVQIDGDSNEPLLSDGDTVMVDHSRGGVEGEAFYVIRLDDHLYAKRLQRQMGGGVAVISANPAYQTMMVAKENLHELQIIGRVVWAAGWMV
ncbi:MAG: helix-turn-helix transcriptional regulator [Pseudomonas sp.]|nr:helix-turn-helix transcriptional regulator [Pseudomonas sp.]